MNYFFAITFFIVTILAIGTYFSKQNVPYNVPFHVVLFLAAMGSGVFGWYLALGILASFP